MGSVGQASTLVPVRGLPALPLTGVAAPLAGVVMLATMLLVPALWNGFPFMFYDTPGYLLEGLTGTFMVERSPVYSLLLFAAGAGISLWLVAVLQAAMTAFIVTEMARAEVPGVTLWGLAGIGLGLSFATGIAWYAGQIEPDAMTPLLVLGCYLLMFRGAGMSRARRFGVFAVTGLCVACHPSHLGLMGGLVICGALLLAARRFLPVLPKPRLREAACSLALAVAMILASNYGLARAVFISRSGPIFVFSRLMQDGIVKRLMDDTCPGSGYRLCTYRSHLKTRVDAWLWGADSSFHALGGFSSKTQQAEDQRIILDSLRRYPFLNLRAAVTDSVVQFFSFRTGDGIEPQMSVIETSLKELLPRQMTPYLAARQQRGLLRFRALNLLHVPVGVLGLLGLLLLIHHAVLRRRWSETSLPALVLLALIGNAIICGTFAEPHDRYQSRVIWLPVLVLFLARMRDPRALQPAQESGT